jgi:sarcosine oxidase
VEKCYYTVTKSEDFLIDWSDEHENVLVVSPCSGHGFKFGPVIGKVVSDILIRDETIPVFEESRFYCRLFYHLGVNLK